MNKQQRVAQRVESGNVSATTAAHEWGHWYAADEAGLNPRGLSVNGATGRIYRDEPDPSKPGQVREAQAMMLAGQIAENRWNREHGRPIEDCSSGDRATFRQAAKLPGSVSMGVARRDAERMVGRHWSSISRQAERHLEQER